MKVITLHAHWAAAVTRLGKSVENRTWAPRPSVLVAGDLLLVHASASFHPSQALALGLDPAKVVTGAIVARCRFGGIVRTKDALSPERHRWFLGPVGWLLDQVEVFETPIARRGQQGLWNCDPIDAPTRPVVVESIDDLAKPPNRVLTAREQARVLMQEVRS